MPDVADALLQRMSLAEKVGQLNHLSAAEDTTGAGGAAADLEARIRRGEVGSLGGGVALSRLHALQTIAVEQSPSKHSAAVHARRYSWPSHDLPIAARACLLLGRGADPPHRAGRRDRGGRRRHRARMGADARRVARCALGPLRGKSRRGSGARRDVRRGDGRRLSAGRSGAAGLGDGHAPNILPATDLSEAGRDYNAADVSPYRMHNVVLPPFKAAVDAGVGAVMVGFHDLAGIPCTAHRELLARLVAPALGLRRPDRVRLHAPSWSWCTTASPRTPRRRRCWRSMPASTSIWRADIYMQYLPQLVGGRPHRRERDIDAACLRVLRAKERLGLFNAPYRGLDEARQAAVTLTPRTGSSRAKRRRRSCVLLKNDGVLPLARATELCRGRTAGRQPRQYAGHLGRGGASGGQRDGARRPCGRPSRHRTKSCMPRAPISSTIPNIAARLNVFGETFADR